MATATEPYDDRDGVIWMNGEMMEWRKANVHVLTHALHYAGAVFEGERVYDGEVFKLREHTQRLIDSAKIMGYGLPYNLQQLIDATKAVVQAQKLKNGYVRPIAWRGPEMGIASKNSGIHVAIACWDWGTYFDPESRKNGIRLTLSKWRRPDPQTAPVHSKTSSLYAICTMIKHDAEKAGFHDGLMLDWRGRVAEATGANFFMVKKGELHTPTPDCFLNGITRRTVIDLAHRRQIQVHERTIMPEELKTADEIFLTGTAAEITPVGQIDDMKYKVGPVTLALAEDYSKEVLKKPARNAA